MCFISISVSGDAGSPMRGGEHFWLVAWRNTTALRHVRGTGLCTNQKTRVDDAAFVELWNAAVADRKSVV